VPAGTASPSRPSDEIRRHFFRKSQNTYQRKQDESILLGILPSALLPMREKAANNLRNQVARRLVYDQRFEDNPSARRSECISK
jgi:hypothetical protein